MWHLLIFAIGIVVGSIFTDLLCKSKTIGTLRVDRSDPDDLPYLFVELSTDPRCLTHDRYVTMKVSTENYISQQ